MKIRIHQNGTSKNVLLDTDSRSMSLLIDPSKEIRQSMMDSVAEIREKAKRALDRADFIEAGVAQLDAEIAKAKKLAKSCKGSEMEVA